MSNGVVSIIFFAAALIHFAAAVMWEWGGSRGYAVVFFGLAIANALVGEWWWRMHRRGRGAP